LAEGEIAAPAPHVGGQLFHCRLDANIMAERMRGPLGQPIIIDEHRWS
jgi:hypothetical protein